jgi:hypothetical protein
MVEFINEFEVPDEVAGVVVDVLVVKVHQALEVHHEFVLVEHDPSERVGEEGGEGGSATPIIQDHNYYL